MKNIHQILAALTISGFVLRGFWMWRESVLLQHRLTRAMPHVLDVIFLATGIAMVFQLHLPVLQTPWLLAKFAGLFVYIVLGAIALRHGRGKQVRLGAFAGALLAFAYVVNTAISKSPLPW